MANSKKLSSQSPEQPTTGANVQTETLAQPETNGQTDTLDTEVPAEIKPPTAEEIAAAKKAEFDALPEFMKIIIVSRETEDAANVKKQAELQDAFIAAKRAYFEENVKVDFAQTPEVIAAMEKMKAADDAIAAFNKTLKDLELERAEADSKNLAKNDLCIKFGIELTKLEELIAASKDEKYSLKSSFTTVFGKPTIFAKQGAKGTDISATTSSKPASDKTPGTGTKKAQALADLQTMTHKELLEKYPTTKNDGTVDAAFLNGTVRGLINELKLTRNSETDMYVPRETK